MRFSCDAFIEIDIIRAVENQIPFYISGNKVILSPGIDGILPVEFFLLVKTRKNVTLYAQKYDYVVYLNFKSVNPNEIENIYIIDIKNENVLKEFNFSGSFEMNEISKFYKLTDYLIECNLFREKIIVSFNQERIENYNLLISKYLKDLRYKSFFIIYITLEKDFDQKEMLFNM